jgi:hypothetical protein
LPSRRQRGRFPPAVDASDLPPGTRNQAQDYFDVTPDGQRFLVNASDEGVASAPITLVVNWTAALKK